MTQATRIGALEAGGTKMRVAVFDADLTIVDEDRFPTDHPNRTMSRIVSFFTSHEPLAAIGVGAFGPITLTGPDRGLIGTTPKIDWQGTNLVTWLEPVAPVVIDTDVGAAALAELDRGAARDADSVFYVTVGTGIGGAYADRRTGVHHGHGHSEIGHLPIIRLPDDDHPSVCPYHDDCTEGMASGPACDSRPSNHRVDVGQATAAYLGQLLASITYSFAPARIVLGGGVLRDGELIDAVRRATVEAINGYSTNTRVVDDVASYVMSAGLGQDAGLIGAALLARSATGSRRQHGARKD